MTIRTLDQHIECTEGIVGGKPRVAGHRITVENIAIWHDRLGANYWGSWVRGSCGQTRMALPLMWQGLRVDARPACPPSCEATLGPAGAAADAAGMDSIRVVRYPGQDRSTVSNLGRSAQTIITTRATVL